VALYTIEEFASYVQSDVDTATSVLFRTLITGLIEELTGVDYATTTATSTAKAIGLESAARAYRNPSGLSSTTVAIDDYSRTDRWEQAQLAARLGLYLTAAEKADLQGGAAFTIRPYYEPPTSDLESWA
jgi:hypothetical protein